ncbi:MAG: succinylglutamate desuccinylase, partial [Sulfurovum sp.]|nr:succinylglutamate desuccinylase/aspartoacylase family protein [Sulfurovum sp.]NNJ46139.1 succinylglutamate desuccinylase [Sulfurovum sp.]
IKIGVKGILNVLRANEMLPKLQKKKSTQIKTVLTKSSKWIRAHESGMIQTLKKLGDIVEEGEVIARIHSLFDDKEYEVISPFDGIIIGKTQIPLTHEGDAAFHIAALNNLKIAEERLEPFHQDETLMETPIEDQTMV